MMWEDIMALVAILIAALGVCLIWCMAPAEVEEGHNVAPTGRRRGRWPGSQQQRPAPAAVRVKEPHQQLVYFPYPTAAGGEGGIRTAGASVVVCAICLEALVGGAKCSEVPVFRHVFHQGCPALWIKSNNICPLCRRPVVPGSEPLSAAEAMV